MDMEFQRIGSKPYWKIVTLFLLSLVIFAFVLIAYFLVKVNRPTSSESRPTNFTVAKGMTTKAVAESLKQEKIIGNSWVFVFYIYSKGASNKIQAGEYSLDPKMSIAEITEILTAGKVVSNERSVTIIEGKTNEQIGKYLIDRQIVENIETWTDILEYGGFETFRINEQAERVNYQGFLFPDTYKLGKEETARDLVIKMLFNFESKVTEKVINDIQGQGPNRLQEVITMASIIEKEVGRNKEKLTEADLTAMQTERELVASVFYNRLEAGIPLQSDATVNYVTGKSDRQALTEDTKIKSPYNTYQVVGLPPGPIGNPGLNSIKAAIYPADSDYLYFLNKIDGEAVFSKTLDEHNANRAKYLD